MEMNKYQLIDAIRHDLGDREKGVQIQGYMNMKIITAAIEGLTALRQGLEKDDEMMREKDAEIERLRAQLAGSEAKNAD